MSGFEGHLGLQLVEDRAGRPRLGGDGRCLWFLDPELVYDDDPWRIICPRRLVTDLASIPRPAWDLLPPDGPYVKAAIPHDFLYRTKGTGIWRGRCWITKPGGYTRLEADQVLNDAMELLGVEPATRLAIYEAVRIGGWIGWGT